jgi:hypothetical protein
MVSKVQSTATATRDTGASWATWSPLTMVTGDVKIGDIVRSQCRVKV